MVCEKKILMGNIMIIKILGLSRIIETGIIGNEKIKIREGKGSIPMGTGSGLKIGKKKEDRDFKSVESRIRLFPNFSIFLSRNLPVFKPQTENEETFKIYKNPEFIIIAQYPGEQLKILKL